MLKNLDDLNPLVKNNVESFAQDIIKLHKELIISICVYGSANREDYVLKESNINILVLLKDIGYDFLIQNAGLVKKYERKYSIIPLLLTERHILSSSDVFPIEFSEIIQHYTLIYGPDILKNIEINTKNIRLECEQQIKGQLIRMYQIISEIGQDMKKLQNMLQQSITGLIPVFKSLIRIKNIEPPLNKEIVIKEFMKLYSMDNDIFIRVLESKDKKTPKKDIENNVATYVDSLQDIAHLVDGLSV